MTSQCESRYDESAHHVLVCGRVADRPEEQRKHYPHDPAGLDLTAALVHQGDATTVFDMEWMSAMGDRLPMTLVAKLIGLPDEDVPRLGDLAVAVNDGDVEPHVAVLMLVQLVAAGGESTAGLNGNAARLLATHPEAQAAGPIHAPILPSARGCTSASGRRWPVPRPGSR